MLMLLVISALCCFCGALYSFAATLSDEPLVLPSGEIAPPQQVQRMALISTGTFAIIALFIALLGIGIWYVFGRETSTQQRLPRFFVILLGGSSLICMLWGVLTALTAPMLDDVYAGSIDISGSGLEIFGFLIGLIPAIFLALTAVAIWVFYVRNAR